MVSLHCAIRRAHPDWLIFPAVLLLSIAGAVVGHSQDSDQVALAAEVPDALYRSQTVRLESPPPNPEELGDAFMLHQRFQAAMRLLERTRLLPANAGVEGQLGCQAE